jgi:L-seryl-tRNA(Ser) seleniumtransferase
VEAAKTAIARARARIAAGEAPERALSDVALDAGRLAERYAHPSLRPVINATGVVLHTNLGRAPLAEAVAAEVAAVAAGYSTLEYDAEHGARGSRHVHVEHELTAITGAEAAMAVNNNAAAVFLALHELARGREVVVSRGQLVEIGGSFRIPDVMAASGARLVEVGTTNKTRLADYRQAFGPETALFLKVHTSNFRLSGFVESTEAEELAALGRELSVPVMEDLGSGVLYPLTLDGFVEPSVGEVLKVGVDLVTFSGDKLLGGPQAGIIAGRKDLVDRLKRNPLARALRVDKMTLAALELTLRLYREGQQESIPLWAMLNASPEELKRRASALLRRLRRRVGAPDGVRMTVRAARAPVGGGSLPGVEMPTAAIRIEGPAVTAQRLEAALRRQSPPVVGRVEEGAVLLDVRTVLPRDEAPLIEAVGRAVSEVLSG